MKNKITELITEYVEEYEKRPDVSTKWGVPIVGFADANHPYLLALKETISSSHQLPSEVLSDASIVIAYYLPFTEELAKTNRTDAKIASPEWALAYEETNALFSSINRYLVKELIQRGYHAAVSTEAATFDQKTLKSNWSQRHFAWAAGLGTFGLNNMLITNQGCCGRYSTIVTNLSVIPDQPVMEEYCLYKKNGSCGICVRNCPSGALSVNGFHRGKCYEILQKNAELYTEFGSSYMDSTGENANSIGSEVCGKCVVYPPCAFSRIRP